MAPCEFRGGLWLVHRPLPNDRRGRDVGRPHRRPVLVLRPRKERNTGRRRPLIRQRQRRMASRCHGSRSRQSTQGTPGHDGWWRQLAARGATFRPAAGDGHGPRRHDGLHECHEALHHGIERECSDLAPTAFLFETGDGGKSWHQVALPAPTASKEAWRFNTVNSFAFSNAGSGEAVFTYSDLNDDHATYCFSTSDGGTSWSLSACQP